MASTSNSIIPSKTKYDVFLSFRGADTRQNFTSHLYAALCRHYIATFLDDDGLDRGEDISLTLLKAIEESKISVIIFSETYAASRWCLDELVKIMEGMNEMRLKPLPVFYHVDPSDVRNQTGNFGEAFGKVKEKFKESIDRVERWITALREAANLSGWDSRNYRNEAELIEGVVDEIRKKLYPSSFSFSSDLVGIDSHTEQILSMLCIESMDIRFIGIWGMGGIGKTTIAEALISQISGHFDDYHFLSNVRENSSKHGLAHLRNCLFSKLLRDENLNIEMLHTIPTFAIDRLRRKKVVVVLDDVNDSVQLDALAGDHDWFGPGSRVIITSRDKEVLNYSCDKIYEVKGLKYSDALQLISMKAFKEKHPSKDFTELSKWAVNYARGVPLAIKVLGSQLCRRSPKECEIILNKLNQFPDSNILKILRISYDELDEKEKDIFLDIACFFKGNNKEWVENILDGCGFPGSWGIMRLSDRCLISIVHNVITMHDLIQEMGQEIAQCKGGRLWKSRDISHMLTTNMGTTKSVEGIYLDLSKRGKIHLSYGIFSEMANLRLLKFYRSSYWSKNKDASFLLEHAQSNCLMCFPNKLSLLHWEEYPYKSLTSNFLMENLVELNLRESQIGQLWNGDQCPQKLKYLNLVKCKQLTTLPDLSLAANLEQIDLWKCKSLVEIPSSIQLLHNLISLDLGGCKKLRCLPSLIQLKSLEYLNLSYCFNLKMIAEIPRGIKRLELYNCGLEEWSASVQFLDNLRKLDVTTCKKLRCLPSIIHFNNAEEINLSGCYLNKLPEIRGNIRTLQLNRVAIKELTSSIRLSSSIVFLHMKECYTLMGFPISICDIKCLSWLDLRGCSRLRKLPPLYGLCSLEMLSLGRCSKLAKLPPLYGLRSLKMLDLSGCSLLAKLPLLHGLCSLEELFLNGTAIVEIPNDVVSLLSLRRLILRNCKKLKALPELPCRVGDLEAENCELLETVVSTSYIPLIEVETKWYSFYFCNCLNLTQNARRTIMTDARLTIIKLALAQNDEHKDIRFVVGLPGSEIPNWFNYESSGCSIAIPLPLGCFNMMFTGFAFGVVLEFSVPLYLVSDIEITCDFCFKNSNGDPEANFSSNAVMYLDPLPVLESDHLFLWYKQCQVSNWLIENYHNVNEASFQFKATRGYYMNPLHFKVKSCGVYFLYAKDNELNKGNLGRVQTNLSLQCGTTNSDFLEKVTETNINQKRSREDNFCSNPINLIVDGTSGSEEEEPCSKRLNQFCTMHDCSSNDQDMIDYDNSMIPSSSSCEYFPTFYKFL